MVTIKGYRGKALPLRWYILDLGTHDIVDQQSKRHLLQADRNETPAVWPFWVALPYGPGPFKIVLQIYPPNAKAGQPGVVPLAETETDPFPGASPSGARAAGRARARRHTSSRPTWCSGRARGG